MALRAAVLAALLASGGRSTEAADLISEARALYNRGLYDAAIQLATQARTAGQQDHDAAHLVLARAYLGRYRQRAAPADLDAAREAFDALRPEMLGARERVEWLIGLGELLFLEGSYGPAAEIFAAVLARSAEAGASARERVLDWWASAVERGMQDWSVGDRVASYRRILDRMEAELARGSGSPVALYWQVVALRGMGDAERAWAAAVAAWVQARLTADKGAALRADLDRFVLEAIVPDRARLAAPNAPRRPQLAEEFRAEWERIKKRWE